MAKMVQKRKQNGGSAMDLIDSKLMELFRACESSNLTHKEIRDLCQPIRVQLIKERLLRYFAAAGCVLVLLWLIRNVSFINFNLSAIGRLALIQVLPYWEWTKLYNEKCLVHYPEGASSGIESAMDSKMVEFYPEDCSVCENFGTCFFKGLTIQGIKLF